jgi:hypothetical protein
VIVHLSPDAPLLVRLATDAALVGHIGGGVIGIAAGFGALAARKGATIHRAAGKVFLGAMIVAFAIAAPIAPLIHQPANSFGALFAVYLLVTAWGAAGRTGGRPGGLERGAVQAAAVTAVVLMAYALFGAVEPRLLMGMRWQTPLVDAGIAALVATLDLRVIRLGALDDARRIRRHLWRMCAAMFIGTGSLFIGQPQVFPAWLRATPVLWILAFAPLAAMAFWLIRIRSARPEPATPVSIPA